MTPNDARLELRAPRQLVDEMKDMATDHGRTFSDDVRIAMRAHYLIGHIALLSVPANVKGLGGKREAERWRKRWQQELAELWADAWPEARARHVRSFPEYLWTTEPSES